MSKPKIPFVLKGITTDRFFADYMADQKGSKPTLNFQHRFFSVPEKRLVGVSFQVGLLVAEREVLALQVSCHFQLNAEYWNSLQEGNGRKLLSHPVALHLATIASGTARGVFHAKAEHTPYAAYFLPTINLTQHITGPVLL